MHGSASTGAAAETDLHHVRRGHDGEPKRAAGEPDSPGLAGATAFLLPGALTIYLAFHAGGFFAGETAEVAVMLILALVLRLTLVEHPLGGLSALPLAAIAAGVALATWMLVSGAWSDSWSRALLEFDRALAYVAGLVLFATVPRRTSRVAVLVRGLAAAAAIVCMAALGSRLFPDLIAAAPNIEAERLSFPLTYWNALGLLAALGITACVHLAAAASEPPAVRVLATAALPALVTTLYFTFSRGSIVAAAIGVVVYALMARPPGLASALVAAAPASAIAVAVAYGAELLSSDRATGAAAAGQAHDVALVTALAMFGAGAMRAALLLRNRRLASRRVGRPRRDIVLILGACAVAALAVGGAVYGLPERVADQYEGFVSGHDVEDRGDVRQRLTNPGNNGRLHNWRIALDGFTADPVIGGGAGTYENLWARDRPAGFDVVDAHSLYMEVLAELGIVGFVLLLGLLAALLGGMATRVRGPDRSVYGVAWVLVLVWALSAGVDWHWEMPAVTLWVFMLSGAVLARSATATPITRAPRRLTRVIGGLALLLVAVTPALVFLSQRDLDRSVAAFKRGDCEVSIDAALSAASVLAIRAEPFELLAYCDARLGHRQLGVRMMREAIRRDPDNWRLHYGLSLVQATAGIDPRPAARLAFEINPREPLTQDAVRSFRTADPRRWRRRALRARLPLR